MDDISFTHDELNEFVTQISRGRHKSTGQANARFARDFIWVYTEGIINRNTIIITTTKLFEAYTSYSSRDKALSTVKRFLNYLQDTRDLNLNKYIKQIESIPNPKPRRINEIIVDDKDVTNLLNHINDNQTHLSDPHQAFTLTLLLAYTGMRPSTADRLTVRHIREAISLSPYPSVLVNHEIDKTGTEHYVPIHPSLIPILEESIKDKNDDDIIFESTKVATFLRNHKINSVNPRTKEMKVKYLRKYFIQKSTHAGLKNDFRDYTVSNEMNTIQWQHYKNFTYEQVYQEYLSVWGRIYFFEDPTLADAKEKPLSQVEILEKEIAEKRRMLEGIKTTSEENIQAEQDRWEQGREEQMRKDDEINTLVYELMQLDEEIENAKGEKGIHF
ncbi:MAG TPA: tyrosine-type recombinase/integrase [Methanoregulaceae archaeon]|nr:tyrosine-type recombinase/integrase [Methanoregulaceae archaeon]